MDDVVFKFRITDSSTHSPLSGAYPEAWMQLSDGSPGSGDCERLISRFLGETIFSTADVDLNVYYVLTLNDDATISVVDPQFGFGGTKLLTIIELGGQGEDWVEAPDARRLFVTLPGESKLAVIDTLVWKVTQNIQVPSRPWRVAVQPDGGYIWVTREDSHGKSGVTVVSPDRLKVAANIDTGDGEHEIAFTPDSRYAIVTNRASGTVSIVDIRSLRIAGTLQTGGSPVSVAFSVLGGLAYVVDSGGNILGIDPYKQRIAVRLGADPGLAEIKFAPAVGRDSGVAARAGRLGFIVNPDKGLVYILDAASNRIVQTARIDKSPDRVAFSSRLAYVRRRNSDSMAMIPLDQVGTEGRRVPVAEFPAGQRDFSRVTDPSPGDCILQVPQMNAVVVANPADKAVYMYEEGMAAPKGDFGNYGREPRAILISDRRIKEQNPGIYQTAARIPAPGVYSLAFYLDSPRIMHCFPVKVEPRADLERAREAHRVAVEPMLENRVIKAHEAIQIKFRLVDPVTRSPRDGLRDVTVLQFLAPGNWHWRVAAAPLGNGVYEIGFDPIRAGVYYFYLECPSLGLMADNPHYFAVRVEDGGKPTR